MKLTKDDISTLYIAGAFGNYVDPESAKTIGLYPEISLEKTNFVGNTVGTGCRMCLVSKDKREYAERISTSVRYYELAVDPDFQREFIKASFLPHKDLDKQPIVAEMLRRRGLIK